MGTRQSHLFGEQGQGEEPRRVDLRERSCWPYLPVDNQGETVSCVAHTFAMALYCALQQQEPYDGYPDLAQVFERALQFSPDRARGVSFEAMAAGIAWLSRATTTKPIPESAAIYDTDCQRRPDVPCISTTCGFRPLLGRDLCEHASPKLVFDMR